MADKTLEVKVKTTVKDQLYGVTFTLYEMNKYLSGLNDKLDELTRLAKVAMGPKPESLHVPVSRPRERRY